MLWSVYALEARTLFWFGHGCSGHHMLSKRERYYGLGMFGHGCSGHRMLSKHERYHSLGMDALVTVGYRNANVIMVWVCGRAKVLENPRQNMHRGPTTIVMGWSTLQLFSQQKKNNVNYTALILKLGLKTLGLKV